MILLLLILMGLSFGLPTPPPLEGWNEWLLKDSKDLDCPYLNGERKCLWMGSLTLNLQSDGADFKQSLHIDREGLVPVVGGTGQWPYGVQVNGQLFAVIEHNGRPYVTLPSGSHEITGYLDWMTQPSSLQVPKGLAQITCRDNGLEQNTQYSTTEGMLRIGEDLMESQVQLRVIRRIEDGHPSIAETLIWLTSTGGHQPLNIGNPFLKGTHPLKIDSRLGTQLTDEQNLIVQPLPGEHLIRIHSLFPEAPRELRSKSQSEFWPELEHWIFVPDPKFRTLQVSGAPTVDRERASLPEYWTENSVYQIAPEAGLELNELHRGDPQPPPNKLRLSRKLWLDTDGKGLSIQDSIEGQFYQSWRLSRSNKAQLGRVSVDGMPQVITDYSDESGVEIRQSAPSIVAESRIDDISTVSTVGWNIQPENLNIELHLPPGWSLITAGGGAKVTNGFWNNTLLLKIILIFAVAGIIGKISKRRWGLLLGSALLFFSNWSIPILLYASLSLIILAYRNSHPTLVWIRRLVMALFAIFMVELCYTEAIKIQHPSADSTQNIESSPIRYQEIIEDYGSLERINKRGLSNFAYQQNIPNAIAQTGVGIPSWIGETYYLEWNDKWIPEEPLELILLSPSEKRMLDCLRLFLLCYGLWQILGLSLPKPEHAVALLLLSTVGISNAHAEEAPPTSETGLTVTNETDAFQQLLSEYKALLEAPPSCKNNCTTTNQLVLEAKGRDIRLQAEVHALTDTYWILPGNTAQYRLIDIELNGQNKTQSFQNASGHIAIRLPKGVSVIEANISLLSVGVTAFELHQDIQNLSFRSPDWSIEGLRPNSVPEPMIKLIPDQTSAIQSLQPHSILERHFDIGHQWKIQNTLRRNPNTVGPLTVNIPLLPSEKVINPNILVSEGQAVVSLNGDEDSVQWTSILPSTDSITVEASNGLMYTETWTFLCAVMHHCRLENLVASQHITDGLWMPHFQPQPNEQLTLNVEELAAATGQIRTIDKVEISHQIGTNTIQTQLSFHVRAATEGNIVLDLPSTQITQLSLNDSDIPIVQDGNALQIPHGAGENKIFIESSLTKTGLYVEIPSPTLPESAVNISLSLDSGPYWLLHVFAPPWGSQSLLPLNILCWFILAFILAKIPKSPLNLPSWFVLFVITIPVSIVVPLLLSLPLLLTHLITTKNLAMRISRLVTFGFFLLIAAGMLIYAILEAPELVTTDGLLEWQIDRSTGELPSLYLFQLPQLAWKGLVLCWAAFVGRIIWQQGRWLQACIRDILRDGAQKLKPATETQPSEISTPTEVSDE